MWHLQPGRSRPAVVAVDPLASLNIRTIDAFIGGRRYTVEGRPAADWLEALIGGTWHEIIPGWLEKRNNDVIARLINGDISDDEIDAAIKDVITIASGRPWWWPAQLILGIAADHDQWSTVHGQMLLSGQRADLMPFGAWLDLFYAVVTKNMDTQEKISFIMKSDMPPSGVEIDEFDEGEAFLSLMAGGMDM